ncbi:P24 [Spodoptera exempta nucleopolyhedrovirus]|uniref:P24 n=1 Tax=Spodoptera exempta nucleopolyhedrovirus TaxID=1242863 RepID=A0A410S7J5_9ABAC|nr:P24 [Spodoptera exempta nucleopolyhedrovirus]QAT90297.1 P24 [Spodoptera exempta nucleopolyhedrovirus]
MFDTNSNVVETNNLVQFQYNDKLLEVVIIENGEDDRDGYVELTAAAQLVKPICNIRGFNPAVMWTNVHSSQRLTRNNKNYVHVFALGKYLSSYRLSSSAQPPELFTLKQLICDLLMGAQSQVVDPLNDIKTQLCNLQECISGGGNGNIVMSNDKSNIYQSYDTEIIRDILRSEHASLYANINNALDTLKNMQADLTNKLAFSNDTMLDGFKSIKDMMNRNKK